MTLKIPSGLAASCGKSVERGAWIERLPSVLRELERRWLLKLGDPFDGGECSYVAPVVCSDGSAGVLKVGMPHMEARDEVPGLRFWRGDPTVRLLEADDDLGAMLLERCAPGTALGELKEEEQDKVIAGLLRRLWRKPTSPQLFRPLS